MARITQYDWRLPIDFSTVGDLNTLLYGDTVVSATASRLVLGYPAIANPFNGNPLAFPSVPGDAIYTLATVTLQITLDGSFAYSAPGVPDLANSVITGFTEGFAETGRFYTIDDFSLPGSVLLGFAATGDDAGLAAYVMNGPNTATLFGVGSYVANPGTGAPNFSMDVRYALPTTNFDVGLSFDPASSSGARAKGWPFADELRSTRSMTFADTAIALGDGAVDISNTGITTSGSLVASFDPGLGLPAFAVPRASGGPLAVYDVDHNPTDRYITMPDGSGGTRLYETTMDFAGNVLAVTAGTLALSGLMGLPYADDASRAAAQAASDQVSAEVIAGRVVPQIIMAGTPAAPPAGTSGELVVSPYAGSNVFTMPDGYIAALVPTIGYQTLQGGSANGEVVIGYGGLTYMAGSGSARVFVGDGPNLLTFGAGAGDQGAWLGRSNDTVLAYGGDDSIAAGAGNNLIVLGAGADSVLAGGTDLIVGGSGDATITAAAAATTIAFLGGGANRFDGGGGPATVVAGAGADTLNSPGGGQFWLGSGSDVVTSSGPDLVVGGSGAATVNTVAGNSLVFGGTGPLLFHGGSGAGTVVGGTAASTIVGGSGSLLGFTFADAAYSGGGGADTLVAIAGRLVAQGGAGTGLFFGSADGANSIAGGSGSVTIVGGGAGDVLKAGTGASNLIASAAGSSTVDASAATGSTLIYAGGPGAFLTGPGVTWVELGGGAETITAGAGVGTFGVPIGRAIDLTIVTWKPGYDFINLQGYPAGEASQALGSATIAGGSESLALSDGTRITFVGYAGLDLSAFN